MKRNRAPRASTLLVSAICLSGFTGCASGLPGVEEERVYALPDGVATVDTFTTVATVTMVDATKRSVSLATPDGRVTRHRIGKDFDLASLKVGERVGVRVTEETVIEIRADGTPASEGGSIGVTAVTDGKAGAVLESEAVESAARVIAVDPRRRKATFQFADGTTRSLGIGRKSALEGLQVGETVILKYAVSVLIATTE